MFVRIKRNAEPITQHNPTTYRILMQQTHTIQLTLAITMQMKTSSVHVAFNKMIATARTVLFDEDLCASSGLLYIAHTHTHTGMPSESFVIMP